MARVYAGILGFLAFLTTMAHGTIHAQPAEGVLFAAWCGLLAFAALGGVLGWIAGRTVEESVRAQIAAEMATKKNEAA